MSRSYSILFSLLMLLVLSNSIASAQSVLFSGPTDVVSIGDLDVPGDQITVEALVTNLGASVNIVSKHTGPANVNYLLRPGGVELSTTNGYVSSPSNLTLNMGECYHVAFTYDGANVKFYVNGCLASTTPQTGNLIQNDFAAGIGNQTDCLCEPWNGYIDEVRIWNVARTEAEIQANMYNLPTPGAQVGLQAYYTFDGDYINQQGNAAWDGVAIGAPQFQANAACQGVDLSFQSSAVTTDVTCPGGSDGTVTFTSSGGHPNYAYSIDGVNYFPTNPVVGLPAGAAMVFARSGLGGCVVQIPIVINEPAAFNVTLVATDASCSGGSDGSIETTVLGGTPPYTFSWDNGSTAEDPSGLSAGNHVLTITDNNNCTTTANVVISEPPPVSIQVSSSYVSAPGVCDGAATANASNGVAPYSYSWDSGGNTQTATGLCEGNHTVTVTDNNGCTAQVTVLIGVPACLTDVDFNTWQQAGVTANGDWQVQNGGAQVEQFINGNPTFYVTPNDFINVKMNGVIRSTYTSDDDYIGFVFGFIEPMGQTDYYDMWLFDWKNGLQLINGYTSEEGFALSRALGNIPPGAQAGGVQQAFFGHENTPAFTVVDTQWGAGNGWVHNTDHQVSLIYTLSRAIMIVDGDTIFNHVDCFQPGRFGFYNYSQQNVIYSQFTYELFVDFDIITPQVCQGDTAFFSFFEQCGIFGNLGQFDELQWDFGDGETLNNTNPIVANVNPNHVYSSPGNYTVQLIALDDQGCRDTVSHDITIFERPTADFTFADVCLGDNTQFTDASTQGNLAITNWDWNMGDGNTSALPSPTNPYGSAGPFNAQLIVEDSFGCRDTALQVVNIQEPPVANFTPIDNCFISNQPFEDQSTIPTGNVVGWEWDFADGTTSNLQNPTHPYAVYGNYDVQLVATSDQGCTDTITQTILLHDVPVPDFILPDICQQTSFQVMDNSTVNEGVINQWSYNFGDGTTATNQNPTHTFQDSGFVFITLIATTDLGCTDTITNPWAVQPKPHAVISVDNVCLNDSMYFVDSTWVAPGIATGWQWTLGDGTIAVLQNPAHLYSTFGTYNIELIATSDQGCLDTTTTTVEVYQLPVADFSLSDICLDDPATFTDLSATNSGVLASWNWNLGDLTLETNQGPISHLYSAPNTYTVELIVASDIGCLDTIQHDIVVSPMPEADFIADSVCFGQPTTFTNQSSLLTGAITAYVWDFGFGASSNNQNPTNVFPQTGYLPVGLLVTSDFGCKDTVQKDIRVYVLPEPEFTQIDTCDRDSVTFTNLSQIQEGTIDLYNWNFGDLSSTFTISPVHLYPTEGLYETELVAVSNFGCSDSVSHQVEVYPLPQLAFSPVPAQGCQPLTVDFNNQTTITSGYSITNYYWEFGIVNPTTNPFPQVLYQDSGSYNVLLAAVTGNGCTDTVFFPDTITVFPRPIAGFETEFEEYLLLDPEVEITDRSFGATEWFYDFDDGFNSDDQNPIHTYLEDGNFEIVQTVYNQYGCDDMAWQPVIVKPDVAFYIPNAFSPDNDGINETFYGVGVGIGEYKMCILDRWGEILFETANPENHWDGTYKGLPVETGTYVYRFELIDVKLNPHHYSGYVFLQR